MAPRRSRSSAALPLVFDVFMAFAVGAAAGGCAGKTDVSQDAGQGAGLDASRPSDAGVGNLANGCPAMAPAQGGSCAKEGLLCEYGDDFNPLCNTVVVCSSAQWASPIYNSARPMCPTHAPTVPPNPSDCASTRAAVPVGQACSTKSACAYDGSSCSCGAYCPSFPIRQPDCSPDAGVTTLCCDAAKVTWNCFDGPPYCPMPRPRIGVACTKDGDSCAVEVPAECGQTVIACEKGVWNLSGGACPISSARFKRDIAYIDDQQAEHLREEVMGMRMATYRYAHGDDAQHLGFIIEDTRPGSPAVLPSRERVDLYGYISMAVAALQQQEKEIEALKAHVARLEVRTPNACRSR